MTEENANLAPAESDVLDQSTNLDDPNNWNFADPDEDEGASVEATAKRTESEQGEEVEAEADPDEPESTQEEADEEPSEEPEGQTEEESTAEEPALIALPNGEKVTQDELVNGYQRDADYRHKTMALAENKRKVEGQAQQLQSTIENLTNKLAALLPDEPDIRLAYDPQTAAQYTAQKAHYDSQLAQMQGILQESSAPKQVMQEVSQEKLQEENAKLVAAFPQTATPEGKQKFWQSSLTGGRGVGYTDAEMQGTSDHRLIGLAWKASEYDRMQAAKKTAKRKVAAAPKAAPQKQRKVAANPQAMQKLSSTGSIHDAVNVDFD